MSLRAIAILFWVPGIMQSELIHHGLLLATTQNDWNPLRSVEVEYNVVLLVGITESLLLLSPTMESQTKADTHERNCGWKY